MHLFVTVALGTEVCHTVCPFAQTVLLANIQCEMCCCSGSRPMASGIPSILDPHGKSSRISCCCLESWSKKLDFDVSSSGSHRVVHLNGLATANASRQKAKLSLWMSFCLGFIRRCWPRLGLLSEGAGHFL